MLYKFQNVWNENSKWLLTRVRCKMCEWKGTKNLTTAKTVLKTRKGIMNGWEAKAKVQTTTKYNVMYRLEQIPKGEVKNRLSVNRGKGQYSLYWTYKQKQPNQRWLSPTKVIIQVIWSTDDAPLLDGEVGFLCFN